MKPTRTFALILTACLLVAAGFSLPWAVSAWQDRSLGSQVTQYEAVPMPLTGLLDHLKLAAHGYSVVSLSQSSARLSLYQAQDAANAALHDMDALGLTFLGQEALFAPEDWKLSAAVPFVAVSNTAYSYATADDTAARDSDGTLVFLGDRDVSVDTSAAIFWRCTFSRTQGEWGSLELILDDETEKMLSFAYTEISSSPVAHEDTVTVVSPSFSLEDADRMMAFCQKYYNVTAADFDDPVDISFPGYLLPLNSLQGDSINLSLTLNKLLDYAAYDDSATCDHLILAFNNFSSVQTQS